MAQRKKISTTYVEWYTIPISWVIGGVLIILIIAGYMVYRRWLGPVVEKAVTNESIPTTLEKAIFANLEGKVEVKKRNEFVYRRADYRLRLENGDFIRTGSDGAATIQCPDGTRLDVPPDSLVRVECQADTSRPELAKIQRGEVRAEVSQNRPEGLITAPNETSVYVKKKGIVHIRFDAEEEVTSVEMLRGRGRVARGREVVQLSEREGARVSKSSPIEKAKLPSTPRVIQPRHREQVEMQAGNFTSVLLEWSGVENAAAYEIEVSSRPDFLKARRYRIQGTSVMLDIPNVFGGRWYYWRVRSVDDKGFFSPYSDARAFSLVEKRRRVSTECPFKIEKYELFGALISIQGRTAPTCSIVFAGDPVAVQTNGSFRHIYRIKKAGFTQEVIVIENLYGVQTKWIMTVNVGDTTEVSFRPAPK